MKTLQKDLTTGNPGKLFLISHCRSSLEMYFSSSTVWQIRLS